LTRLVQETPSGRSVAASIVRDGQRSSLTVTPEDSARFSFDRFDGDAFARMVPRPPAPPNPPSPPAIWKFDELLGRSSRLGMTVDSLSPQLAEYFGTKRGALVSSVTDNSAAAKAGIKAGDVITSINGSTVDDPADVRRRIQDLREGNDFTIDVMRDRKPLTLKGQIERTQRRSSSRSII
jgi:S1-C subfamily serine protease